MAQNGTTTETALTPRQLEALPYLVAGRTLGEGAELADIGRRTLYNWLEDDRFRQEFQRLRSHAADIAKSELNGLMLKSALILGEALEHDAPHIRLRAAKIALSIGLKANDLKEIQQRLDRLDDAIHLWAKNNLNW